MRPVSGYVFHGVEDAAEEEERRAELNHLLAITEERNTYRRRTLQSVGGVFNDVVAVLHKEVGHEEGLQIVVDDLHLDVEDILQEEELVDDVVGQLSHAGIVAMSDEKSVLLLRLHHLVHSDDQRDDVVDELLEILEGVGLSHVGDVVLIVD